MFNISPAEGQLNYRFSGHETFACRYAWLPKAYRAIAADASIFYDEDAAMVELGIGKNMVRALRFWVDAMGIARPTSERKHEITDLGHTVFGSNGCDPYLEDARTLWLLHWNLTVPALPDGAEQAGKYLGFRLRARLPNRSAPEFTSYRHRVKDRRHAHQTPAAGLAAE